MRRWAILASILLVACTDTAEGLPRVALDAGPLRDAGLSDAGHAGADPDIDVIPRALIFGLVSTHAPTRRSLLVTSVGWAPLTIHEVGLGAPLRAAGFALDDGPEVWRHRRLAVGDTLVLTLSYGPEDFEPVEGKLWIESDDPDEPRFEVRIFADGTDCCACRWGVTPTAVDFGRVPVGEVATASVTLANTGDRYSCLIRAEADPACGDAFPPAALANLELAPGEVAAWPVRFSPSRPGAQDCLLSLRDAHIFSDTATVALRGVGVE